MLCRGAVLFALSVLCFSCATQKNAEDDSLPFYHAPTVYGDDSTFTILQKETDDNPSWINAFLAGGERQIGALSQYSDYYAFVAVEKGESLPMLEKWSDFFRAEQDSAGMVVSRLYEKLRSESKTTPEAQYGVFAASFLKKAARLSFPSAVLSEHYWIKVEVARDVSSDAEYEGGAAGTEAETTESENIEEYHYYILLLIEKDDLEDSVALTFSKTQAETALDKQKNTAVSRLKDRLFIDF